MKKAVLMKTRFRLHNILMFGALILPFLPLHLSFSQCSTLSTVLSENFTYTSHFPSGALDGTDTIRTLGTGQTFGTYATGCANSSNKYKSTITNNAYQTNDIGCCGNVHGQPCAWRQTSNTGNDGGGNTDFALIVDGCTNYPDASFWCYNVTVSPGEQYSFSSYVTSPWYDNSPTNCSTTDNNPDVYYTINGVNIGQFTIDEYNDATGTPTPYTKYCYSYTIPVGTSGSVPFCMNLKQRTGGSASYGADGQANDILVDDIVIKKVSSTCTSAQACNTSTPVTLLNFQAAKNGSKVDIDWQTATEINNNYFIVEKSKNGVDFIALESIKGAGNSQQLLSYETTDPSPYNGTSYYRLKQVDFDGKFSYSKIVAVQNDESEVNIYPNPNQGSFKISVSNEKQLYSIEVADVEGRLIYTSSGNPDNTITEITGLSKGVYVVRVIGENTMVLRKLVVI